MPVNALYYKVVTRNAGKNLWHQLSFECFIGYGEANKKYKLLIIQFNDSVYDFHVRIPVRYIYVQPQSFGSLTLVFVIIKM
jgi:hypothetical protein